MVKKHTKRFLSILLTLLIASSCFAMNFSVEVSAEEENVASIGDVYYNSLADALNAATSGQTVILQKDITLTEDVTVPAGVTLLLPYKDGYTGYDVKSGKPDLNENKKDQTLTLYRQLTIPEGVTVNVNGYILVSALMGMKAGAPSYQDVGGAYSQINLNGKMNVNNGGKVVANGYIKGTGIVEGFSGAEIRDLFVISHWRGGTHASYMRSKGVWIGNEYDMHNIQCTVIANHGCDLTGLCIMYYDNGYCLNTVAFASSSSNSVFVTQAGGKVVKTYEYRERLGGYADVYEFYGGGYLGQISLKIYVSILPITVNSSSFVVSMDGDNELHLYDGTFGTYYDSKAISMKFLPGCEVYIHDGATFSVDRYKTSTRDRYSQIIFYRELTDEKFGTSYRYPQGRPAAKLIVEDGGALNIDGEFGGEVYLSEGAKVTKGEYAVFSVTTKESDELKTSNIKEYTNAAEWIVPEGYHTRWSGNELVIEEHSFTGAITDSTATCETAGTGKKMCSLDGCDAYEEVEVAAYGHDYKSVVTAPTCDEKGYTTYTCENCGDSYVADYVNALGHTEKITTVDATCETAGSVTKTCANCGEVVSVETIPAKGHNYKTVVTAPTCMDKGYTTYTCANCGDNYVADYVDALGHAEKTVTVDATCEEAGSVTTVCTVCDKVLKVETIEALGHTEKTVTVDATCEEAGSVTTVCTVCDKVLNVETIEALGHTGKTVTVDATCEDAGTVTTTCTVCDKVLNVETINALGHTGKEPVIENNVDSDCVNGGSYDTVVYCAVCGKEVSRVNSSVDALGHTSETVTVDATCETAGSITTTCTTCGVVISVEEIPALGHTEATVVVDATCEETGSVTTTCTVCNKVLKVETIEALGHTASAAVKENEKAADCENNGSYDLVVYCAVCGKEISRDTVVVNANGHDYVAEVTAPTCEDKGYTTYTCSVCSDSYIASYVDSLGHTAGKVVIVDATALKEGSKTTYCSECDAVISVETIAKLNGKVVVTAQSNGQTILTGVVGGDYTANISVPKGTVVNAGEVTGTIIMTDIASLGINGTKKYEKLITTGIEKEVLLDNYLPYFTNAQISGTIDGVAYGYNITGVDTEESYTITAVPQDEKAVAQAWSAFAANLETGSGKQTIIPGTAYIQIGAEKLSFKDTSSTLVLNSDELSEAIKANLKVETVEELEDAQAEIFIPAGTVIALGSTQVTFKDDTTITISGYRDSDDVNTILSSLLACNTNEEFVKTAVLFLSDLANAIEGKSLTLNVEFGHEHEYEWKVIEDASCTEAGEKVKYCVICGEVAETEVIPATGHNFGEWVVNGSVAERICSNCGLTEQKVVEDSSVTSLLKLIRGTASFKTYNGQKYIAITIAEGKTATGFYKEMTNGGTVEITDINGNVQVLADRYVAYQSQNMTNPTATMKITYADGTVETYPVVFELYNVEREINFNPAEKIKPIRGTVSLATDEKGDYILVTMNEGQSSVGIYKASLDDSTITFVDAEGMYTEQEKLYIFYGSQNDFNPEGKVSVTEADGTTKTYRIVYKLYETDPNVNAAKGLRPIRGAVTVDADGTIRIKMTSGQTSVGLYKTTANGTTFQIVDANGKLTNNPSSLMFYKTNNVANVTATIIFTMPDGTTKEQKIIFDLGLADNPDPLVYLESVRGSLSYQNDGTEEYIELKANAGSTGVGLYKDCLVKYTITDVDGVMTENDSRYYLYKSQNPDGTTANINFLQSDGSYKTYKLVIVF